MATVYELDSGLSKARLALLDKRKEIRETVHEHYKELIGVTDRAECMNEKTELIANSYSRMATLGRALRVKAATAKLSGDSPRHDLVSDAVDDNLTATLSTIETILSLNGRVLQCAIQMKFSEVATIIRSEIPPLASLSVVVHIPSQFQAICAREIASFSVIPARVRTHCMKALQSPSLLSKVAFVDCINLIRFIDGDSSTLTDEFWNRRTALLLSTKKVADLIQLYDLTLAVCQETSIRVDEGFVTQFGSIHGAIANQLFNELHHAPLHKVGEQYVTITAILARFRETNTYTFPSLIGGIDANVADTAVFIAAKFKQIAELAIRNSLADLAVQFDTLEVGTLENAVSGLTKEAVRFNLWPRDAAVGVVGTELAKRLIAAAVDSDRGQQVGVSLSVLIASIEGTPAGEIASPDDTPCLRQMAPSLTTAVTKLRELQKDSFDVHFDELCFELSAKGGDGLMAVVPMGGQCDQVAVPTHLSPPVFHVVFEISIAVISLPPVCHSVATQSAKSALSRFFCSRFSNPTHTFTIQTLFDAAALVILASGIDEDSDYDYLSTQVYANVVSRCLADPVDLLLYRDLIRRAALVAVSRNAILFQPLLAQNPLFAHLTSTPLPVDIVSGPLTASLVNKGESVCDRFTTLPVSRSIAAATRTGSQAPTPASASQSKRGNMSVPTVFNANSVTSFFNQVGKITLGSK